MNEPVCVVPVLVVGAGPAGLTTAVTLARQGVESLLVERRRDLSALPRATVISTRSMELLRSWGLEEEIAAGAVDVQWRLSMSETLAQASAGSALPVGYPTREQSAVISPTAPACVAQDHLEPVLLGHLRALGVARAAFGTEVTRVELRPDGVEALLRDVASGDSRVIRARYLVAADGAHSSVRAALGIPMRGPDQLLAAVTTLFRAPLWSVLGQHRYGIYGVTHPEAGGTFLPAGPGDRWLYGVQLDPGQERVADFTEERMARLIRLGAGVSDLQPRIERIGGFAFAAQLAERFRRGSASSSVTPPTG